MIINLFARELSGMSPTLWLLKSSDGTLTNVGGDALTESDHGHFVASVSESINELHYAFVTIAGVAVRDGWLVPGESLIRDTAPSSDLAQLDRIEAATAQITGARLLLAGAVTPAGTITLVFGSDYVDELNSILTRSVSDPGKNLFAQLTAGQLSELIFSASPAAGSIDDEKIAGTITAVTESDGVTSVTIAIDRAAIPSGPYTDGWQYQIWRETEDYVSPPLLQGGMELLWRS